MAGQPDAPNMHFDVTGMTVTELGGVPVEPQTIFDLMTDVKIEGTFEFSGMFAEGWNDMAAGLGYQWVFTVTAESFGPQPEMTVGTNKGGLVAGTYVYGPGAAIVPTVNAGPGFTPIPAGVWKLTGLVTFEDAAGTPVNTPYVGYYEGPIIQVH